MTGPGPTSEFNGWELELESPWSSSPYYPHYTTQDLKLGVHIARIHGPKSRSPEYMPYVRKRGLMSNIEPCLISFFLLVSSGYFSLSLYLQQMGATMCSGSRVCIVHETENSYTLVV